MAPRDHERQGRGPSTSSAIAGAPRSASEGNGSGRRPARRGDRQHDPGRGPDRAPSTGIARRPYPTATDQRFAVTPAVPGGCARGRRAARHDRRIASTPQARPARFGRRAAVRTRRPRPRCHPVRSTPTSSTSRRSMASSVRVGGLVVDLRRTASRSMTGLRSAGSCSAAPRSTVLALIEPDDALNAIGRVELRADGPSSSSTTRAASSSTGDPVAAPRPGSRARRSPPQPSPTLRLASGTAGLRRAAGLTGAPWPLDAGAAGLGSLALVSVALAGRDAPPQAAFATPSGGPGRRPSGHVRGVPGASPARRSIPAERGPSTSRRGLTLVRTRETILGRVSRQRSSPPERGRGLAERGPPRRNPRGSQDRDPSRRTAVPHRTRSR